MWSIYNFIGAIICIKVAYQNAHVNFLFPGESVLNIKICPMIKGIYIFNKVNIDESIISFLVNKYIAARNAVLHVGTNALFKREYVDEIGGYPTCSITEDMAVGMLLQSRGYDCIKY
mgnify:CR=1 FL=1